MFKSAPWRSNKKIKAVFMMTFQATQVPKLKAKTLMISLVPADVGKPTVRLEKTSIVEGTCSWENPVYETVKLVKETKTGKYKEKIYHFVVSTGSSKKGILGESWIDFADFLEATNPTMLSLSLDESNSGPILHVTIQNLEGTLNQRCVEGDGSPTIEYYRGNSEVQQEKSDNFDNKYLEFTQPNRITSHHQEQSIGLRYTQSQDNKDSRVCKTTEDKMPETVTSDANIPGNMHQRCPDGSFEDISDESVMETTISPREKTQDPSNDVGKTNTQIKLLERQAEVSGLEIESLRRQIAKESKKVQELAGQVVALKQEKETLKMECEQRKALPKRNNEPEVPYKPPIETDHLRKISEEIKQELSREKHFNKQLKFQLQKTEDSNSELILAVRDLKEELNRKNTEICKLKAYQNDFNDLAEACEQNKADEAELLKKEITNLLNEIELSGKEKEGLKMCILQLTLDYESLKKENREVYSDLQQKQTEIFEMQHEYSDSMTTVNQLKLREERFKQEMKNQELLYDESLATIGELETKVKSLENKLNKEAKDFQDRLTKVSRVKVEQEQRAVRAEEALRGANWSETKMTESLREEFRKKSEEMTSQINENEKLAMQAVAEANELRRQNEVLQKLLQKANDELQLNINGIREKSPRLGQLKRYESFSRREKKTGSPYANHAPDLGNLVNEINALKEENKHMAVELKEMQERYSEISLKFAEVEGERQQLVMALRNLKNGKKTESSVKY